MTTEGPARTTIEYASGGYIPPPRRPWRLSVIGCLALLVGVASVIGNVITLPTLFNAIRWTPASLQTAAVPPVPELPPQSVPPPPYTTELLGPRGMNEAERDLAIGHLLDRRTIVGDYRKQFESLLAEIGHDIYRTERGAVTDAAIAQATLDILFGSDGYNIWTTGGHVVLGRLKASFRPNVDMSDGAANGDGAPAGQLVFTIEGDMFNSPGQPPRTAWRAIDAAIQAMHERYQQDFSPSQAGVIIDLASRMSASELQALAYNSSRMRSDQTLYLSHSAGNIVVTSGGQVMRPDEVAAERQPSRAVPPPSPPQAPAGLGPFLGLVLIALAAISTVLSILLAMGGWDLLLDRPDGRRWFEVYAHGAIAITIATLLLFESNSKQFLRAFDMQSNDTTGAVTLVNTVMSVVVIVIIMGLVSILRVRQVEDYLRSVVGVPGGAKSWRGVPWMLAAAGVALVALTVVAMTQSYTEFVTVLRRLTVGVIAVAVAAVWLVGGRQQRRGQATGRAIAVAFGLVAAGLLTSQPAVAAGPADPATAATKPADDPATLANLARTDAAAVRALAGMGKPGLPTLLEVLADSDVPYLKQVLPDVLRTLPPGLEADPSIKPTIQRLVPALLAVIDDHYAQQNADELAEPARAAGVLLLRLCVSEAPAAWTAVLRKAPSLHAEGDMFRTLAAAPQDGRARDRLLARHYAHRQFLLIGALFDERWMVRSFAARQSMLPLGDDPVAMVVDKRLKALTASRDRQLAASARSAIEDRRQGLASRRPAAYARPPRWTPKPAVPEPPAVADPESKPTPVVEKADLEWVQQAADVLQIGLISIALGWLLLRLARGEFGRRSVQPLSKA